MRNSSVAPVRPLRSTSLALLVGLLVVLQAAPALATSVLRLTVDDLTDRAEVIVHGRCLSKQARQTPDGVVTDYRFAVIEGLKGAARGELAFTAFGGVLGRRGSAIAGAPSYEVGEEVLVFLDAPNAAGWRNAIGLAQGKFSIREVDGRRLAYRNLEGLSVVDPVTGEVTEGRSEQAVPFDELLARVKARLER